jgi:peptidoglycan/LPS O-acetylase OafA/YrhL
VSVAGAAVVGTSVAAVSVMFSHAFLIADGTQKHEWLIRATGNQSILGLCGVFVFFAISGFLVTQSWEHTRSLQRYAAKRALRIYPGLAVCILVLIFGLGPAVTSLPLGQYLGAYGTYDFLVGNLLLHTDHNSLPGVWFTGQAIGNVVDGPLWSLPVEVAMYAMVATLGLMRAIRLPVLAVLLGIGIVCLSYDTTRYYDFIGSVGWMLGFFVVGMMLYRLRDRRWLLRWPIALSALIGLAVSVPLGVFLQVFPIFGGVLIIYIALHPAVPVVPAARFGDLSYGLYIYGWPVEQIMLYLRPDTGPVALFLLALAITAGVAFLSWHLVEKRALRWKPRASAQPALAAAPVATP